VKKQYEEQVAIFHEIGLLEFFPEAEAMGIVGIDGREFPIPEREQIQAYLRENKDIFEEKAKQGFTELSMTPFALPLDYFIDLLTKRLLAHKDNLLATKEKPSDPDEKLELNVKEPLWVSDEWPGSDVSGNCKYYPKSFDKENHQGKTKQEVLDEQIEKKDLFAGWKVQLNEASKNIPREGKGKTVGGRKQLEADWMPRQYLDILQTDPQYRNEQGKTFEDWIIEFITYLEKTSQVMDDYDGKGSACYLIGSYLDSSGVLGGVRWNRDYQRVGLGSYDPGYQFSYHGLRSAAGLGEGM
jgi:hypothetical protein